MTTKRPKGREILTSTAVFVLATSGVCMACFAAAGCVTTQQHTDRDIGGVDVSHKTPRKSYEELKGIAFAAFQSFMAKRAEPYEGLPRQYYDQSDMAFHVFIDGRPDEEQFRFIFSSAELVGDGSYHVIIERQTGKILKVGVGR